jgi:hypothetical protein
LAIAYCNVGGERKLTAQYAAGGRQAAVTIRDDALARNSCYFGDAVMPNFMRGIFVNPLRQGIAQELGGDLLESAQIARTIRLTLILERILASGWEFSSS